MTCIRDGLAPIFGLLQVGETVTGSSRLARQAEQGEIFFGLAGQYWAAVSDG